MWFTVCFGRLYFVHRYGDAPVELQRSLVDAAILYSMFISMIRFVQTVCYCNFIVQK